MGTLLIFIYLIFIIFFFKYDLKKNSEVSSALWIPLLWVLYTSSKSIDFWLNPEKLNYSTELSNYLSGNPVDRSFLTVLMFFGIIILLRRNINWKNLLLNNIYLLIFFLFALISIIWSDFKVITFKRWFRAIGDVICVLILITEVNPYKAIICLIRRTAVLFIPLSIILIKYFRYIGVAYTWDYSLELWRGVTGGKNMLGQLAGTCATFLFIILYKQWKQKDELQYIKRPYFTLDSILLLMCLILLNGSSSSRSSTSLGMFLMSIFLTIIIYKVRFQLKNVRIFLISFGILYLSFNFLTTVLANKSIVEYIVNMFGRDMTLTGRVPLWEVLLERSKGREMVGVGYGAYWIGTVSNDLWSIFIWKPTQAHNGYIDIYIELGWMGIIILIFLIINGYLSIEKYLNYDFDLGLIKMVFFITILISNITESSFGKATYLLWFLFLIGVINNDKNLVLNKKNNSNN